MTKIYAISAIRQNNQMVFLKPNGQMTEHLPLARDFGTEEKPKRRANKKIEESRRLYKGLKNWGVQYFTV
jgi:hypothetical protein